jgi:hypothetical protein
MANYKMSKPVFELTSADRDCLDKIAHEHSLDYYDVNVIQALRAAFRAGYDDAKSKAKP